MVSPETATALDARFVQDAHAVAEQLRREGPVRPVILPTGLPAWLVTGYDDARALLTDSRLSSAGVYDRLEKLREAADGKPSSFSSDLARHLLNTDPPDHTRLRKLVNKAFTPRTIARLRPRIVEIADELLDTLPLGEPVDLIAAYAYPLPMIVICELLGIPATDRSRFGEWSNVLVSSAPAEEIGAASAAMGGYLAGLVEQKRAEPTEDLLSALVHVSEDGDRLSLPELIAMTFILLIGGYETSVNLIGSGLSAVLHHPDQLAELRAEPALLPSAVEEFLRFETPNNTASPRYTTEEVEVGGVRIPAGAFVLISLLGANRDGKRFEDPDRLDVRRPATGHLGFGHGIHFCVGAPLGRLEGEIGIGRLLERFEHLELAAEPGTLRWRASTAIHGLETLPVRLG
ncbi:cytochrome P450 [Kitasatospora paracochleata]|uniref:Cytochrome P450 n=1 Tax=Kitasatospora paracochleata TaxID=58354 RepID=A0ABT1IWE7_9ACTN|nr:cytochrome P450 [Kitasatospora paracochleata]MCP2309474.1 cytochrome P450 [Kitasatospora paracochleata]